MKNTIAQWIVIGLLVLLSLRNLGDIAILSERAMIHDKQSELQAKMDKTQNEYLSTLSKNHDLLFKRLGI